MYVRYLINCLCNKFFKLSKDFMDTLYIGFTFYSEINQFWILVYKT